MHLFELCSTSENEPGTPVKAQIKYIEGGVENNTPYSHRGGLKKCPGGIFWNCIYSLKAPRVVALLATANTERIPGVFRL